MFNGNVKFSISDLKIELGKECTPYIPYGIGNLERILPLTSDTEALNNLFKE